MASQDDAGQIEGGFPIFCRDGNSAFKVHDFSTSFRKDTLELVVGSLNDLGGKVRTKPDSRR